MLTVYYSNQLNYHKELLIKIIQMNLHQDLFHKEVILVQNFGMAQWLKTQIAQSQGIVGNIQFQFPSHFLWQQFQTLFPKLPDENVFEKENIIWRLMRIIPSLLSLDAFSLLNQYLNQNHQDQVKLYQLADKIAELFEQYILYRPNWIIDWEQGKLGNTLNEISQSFFSNDKNRENILQNIEWQSILWNKLIEDIKQTIDDEKFIISHRVYIEQAYFKRLENLTEEEKNILPKNIFIFGVSSIPPTQLRALNKLGEYYHIHLFFMNPSQYYWGDGLENKVLEKLVLEGKLPSFNNEEPLHHPLLMSWGKQGKEFLSLLVEQEPNDLNIYQDYKNHNLTLLTQIKRSILDYSQYPKLDYFNNDDSIQIHSCHSMMREVEILHNNLLTILNKSDLLPKDIIVMATDISEYAPYIHAVFGKYDKKDSRFLPYSLSDQKQSDIDPIISSFLTLLSIKEYKLSAEDILDFLSVSAIRDKLLIAEHQLPQLRNWIKNVGIRAGLNKDDNWENYNSWENGIERLLLGSSLKQENNVWQDIIAFDESYGLSAEISAKLANIIAIISDWASFSIKPQSVVDWRNALLNLIDQIYLENEESGSTLIYLRQTINELFNRIINNNFDRQIDIDVIYTIFKQEFDNKTNNLSFLSGKINFCTLLPMRAIPFKVICLLGMNESDFPRQKNMNHFDLMQFAPQKGDRAKRDDDRYLFLEALLSAQDIFYISYIGQSNINNQEKLPSILVSQLIEYIKSHLHQEQDLNIIYEHPLSPFSPSNFIGKYPSYEREWIFFKENDVLDFLHQKIEKEAKITKIALDDLVSFLQNPIKFFFNRQLSVYFREKKNYIDKSERFNLSPLDKYNLFKELILLEDKEVDSFFYQEKLKGNLTPENFSYVDQGKLVDEIAEMRTVLFPYFRIQEDIFIQYELVLNGENILVDGSINNKFNNEVVLWRVGDLRDKDMILAWVYQLVITLIRPDIDGVKYYFRSKDKIKCLSFDLIDLGKAQEILHFYLEQYIENARTLNLVIYENLKIYMEQFSKIDVLSEIDVRNKLNELTHSRDGYYLNRVLMQMKSLNYTEIHHNTLAYFQEMINLAKFE